MKRILIAALLLLVPVFSWARGLDLALSDETAYLNYYFNYDPLYQGSPGERDGGSVVSAGVFSVDLDDRFPDASLGNETVGALALGFQAGLLLRPAPYNPVDLSFEGFYSPSITSFADAEGFGEISARLQVEITTRARAFIGYRRMRFDIGDIDNVAVDRSAHIGLSITF